MTLRDVVCSNYKKISSMNTVLRPEFKAGRGEFTRKGEIGDWVNHFDEESNKKWNVWIDQNLDHIGIKEGHYARNFFQKKM